jgi:DNA-directed RNA polymerase subunit H (RpoH/RPB5)
MEKVDITKHSLVPEHNKLSEEEKQKLLKKHNISLRQLPKILKSDPAIQHLDIKVGDLIKIKRKSPTNKESIFYRVVING